MFSETFEGAFPGNNGWSVGDLTSEPLSVGYDYWDDTSYKNYNGGWSGWSAQIGNQPVTSTVTDTIFTEGFEGAWPGSWTVYDDSSWWGGSDYWGDTTYRKYEYSWSGWVADEGYDYWGRRNSDLHLYDNYMDAYMYRPVNLNGYDSITLSYRYWIKSEKNYDYLEVIYYDGGKWNYFDRHTDNSYGWQQVSVSIPKTATKVGFYFHSDYSNVDEGAYLDEIKLEGTKTTTTHVLNSDLHQYDDYMDAYMQKQINLASYSSATLSYKYWLDVEDYYDWLKVQTSSDGSNWVDKKTYSDGYDSKDGDSKARQWYSDSIDLTSYAGSNVYIRFLFHSDSSVHNREGAYLDDITVDATPVSPPQPQVSLLNAPSSTKLNQEFTISIKLQNNGGASTDGGVHLHFDDLERVSVSNGDFSSNAVGSNYVEFYGSAAGGTTQTASITLKATGLNAKIYYRGWLKSSEQVYCSVTGTYENKNYRDPSDVQCRANFMDYTTYTKPVSVIYYGVSLSPPSQSKTVNVGEIAVYTFTIKNEGNVADTFSLGTTRGTLSTSSVSLNAGASTAFTLTDSSSVSGTYTATITATSQGDSSKKATATAVTTFVALLPDLSISPEDIFFEKAGGG